MRNFRDQCLANPDFAGSVRTLHVSRHNLEGSDILRQLLPRLRRLTWAHLYSLNTDVALLSALADQVNVKMVFVESLPSLSDAPLFKADKFLLHRGRIQCPGIRVLEPHLRRGMQVAQLVIHRPGLLQDEFGLQRFPGLREMELIMGWEPVPLSWLHEFTSAHPMLQKIMFIDQTRFCYCYNLLLLSFTIHFQDQVQKESLNDTFDLSKLVIGRTAQTSEEWHVTGLGVVVKRSLSQVISLMSSCFPKVSVLTVEFKGEDVYHIDELISLLRKFPSLHTLGLRLSFNRLHFDGQEPWTRRRYGGSSKSNSVKAA
ncbi:hypothetical protein BT96DRAFT_1007742 [Gymnopus androsaceus JB14]|uniref:F-box domain-containing protein n=1 Tax=Gymnopus androsaceus JB14 TaxID=1447944 RepID=A0A6A4GHD8_9AGAR|nr:hypothetical protein BT96DRAFT_1007742 [Gymnopus androsaceus JB14]